MNNKLPDENKPPIRITEIIIQGDAADGRITPVTSQETKQIIENSITQSSQLKRSQPSSSESKNV